MAGVIGSIFTRTSIPKWYSALAKPALTPPNFIFPIVWTILYILMGIALYLVWTSSIRYSQDNKKRRTAIKYFLIQLVLNALWSILFFGLESPISGLVCIVALWLFVLLTIDKFYTISRKASYLLVPYILWITFAAYLNLMIFVLN